MQQAVGQWENGLDASQSDLTDRKCKVVIRVSMSSSVKTPFSDASIDDHVLTSRAHASVFPGGFSAWAKSKQPHPSGEPRDGTGQPPPQQSQSPAAQLIDKNAGTDGKRALTAPAETLGWTVDVCFESPASTDVCGPKSDGALIGDDSTVVVVEGIHINQPVEDEPGDYRRHLMNQLFESGHGSGGDGGSNYDRRSTAILTTVESELMDGEDKNVAQWHHQQQQQQQLQQQQLNGDDCSCSGNVCSDIRFSSARDSESVKLDPQRQTENPESVLTSTDTAAAGEETPKGCISSASIGVGFARPGCDGSPSVSSQTASPILRSRSCRKSSRSGRKRSDGSAGKSSSPSPAASPVSLRLNASESGTDDIVSNGDEGSGDDDDEDDGIYGETFRYSSYKYIGGDNDDDDDDDVTSIDSSTDKPSLANETSERLQDGRVGYSRSESKLYDRFEKLSHQRSLSMTTAKTKGDGDICGKTLSKKIIKRHISMGAETYQMPSERVYKVERTLILKKPDPGTSYGFHLLGQNPMVISTVESGSIAELSGAQIGDRLVTVNGTNVVKASQSTLIDIISQSPDRIELGVASGILSRDICICSGYLNLKPDGIMRNWKRRWCQLKHDGFLYYYRADDACSNPLGAISMSNYVIIRGSDSGRNSAFKLVKYGQKTFHIQADSEEEMNRWASNINMTTSKSHSLCDTWLDISSHNVQLPALSIRSPECHGYLTKVGYRNTNWRKRYCILKSACLYYYKDQTSSTAKGVAHLHGYSVEEETLYHRRFGFMAVPPVAQMRTFHFTAENETDKQRWIAALKESIGKWVKVED